MYNKPSNIWDEKLFRGYIMKVQQGANFISNKYYNANKIIVQNCVEFYMKCQRDRNETLHDKLKQRERIIEWFYKVKADAETSEYL